MADLVPGDQVFDEIGNICNVLVASEVMTGRDCFSVEFSDGAKIVADAEHRWRTSTRKPEGRTGLWTTRQIAETLRPESSGSNHSIDDRHITAVLPIPSVPVKCIGVDSPSHLYLAGKSMIPTHNTEWAAGLALLVLILSVEPGCQVYGAAAATRQAMNVYRAACKMVEQSPLLRKRLRIMRGTNRIVKRNDPDSFYAAIAADGDGVNPSCVIADEVHRWKTRKHLENWDVLTNGGVTRRQTLSRKASRKCPPPGA